MHRMNTATSLGIPFYTPVIALWTLATELLPYTQSITDYTAFTYLCISQLGPVHAQMPSGHLSRSYSIQLYTYECLIPNMSG